MAERLTRKALYDLVWSQPMSTLAERFGISDVGLKKTCAQAGIPTPDRGYWAKKDAGKETFQAAFQLRPPGMDDHVEIGSKSKPYNYWTSEDLLGPIGAQPEFSESIETVRARIVEVVGRVVVSRRVLIWHSAIARLLIEDEKRRDGQLADPYPMSWNNPLFDTPFERRRLLRGTAFRRHRFPGFLRRALPEVTHRSPARSSTRTYHLGAEALSGRLSVRISVRGSLSGVSHLG